MAAVVGACSFVSPSSNLIISDVLCWVKNLRKVYSPDRVCKFLVSFCSPELLASTDEAVSSFSEGLPKKLGAASKRTKARSVDYSDCYKIAVRLVECAEEMISRSIKLCSEDTNLFPPIIVCGPQAVGGLEINFCAMEMTLSFECTI